MVEWPGLKEPIVNSYSVELIGSSVVVKADLEFMTHEQLRAGIILSGYGSGVAFIPRITNMRCVSARHTLITNRFGRLFSQAEYTMSSSDKENVDIFIEYREYRGA